MREKRLPTILAQAMAKHKIRTSITFLTIFLSVILELLPPLVLAKAVDALTNQVPVSFLYALTYFFFLSVSSLMNAIREGMIVAFGESITHSLRSEMMVKLHHLPSSYFTRHQSGSIASLFVNDVDAIEEMFSSGIISLITDLGEIIGIMIVVFTKSLGLAILLMIALPILALFTMNVQKKMLKAHLENRQAAAAVNGILPEVLHNIRSLHVYHAEDYAEQRYDQAVRNSFNAMEQTNYYDSIYSPIILTVSAIVIATMMSLSGTSGAFRQWFGISVGTAIALISYVNQIFTPLSSIGMEIQTVQSAAAGWKRVQTFLNEQEISVFPSKKPEKTENAIEVRDVSFSYDPGHTVLKDFSLTVRKGEFVTVAGRTGIGKSTLFKLILGLYEPEKGMIRIENIVPFALAEKDKRKTICCVEQKASVVPGTIKDQITLGNPSITDKEVWAALEMTGLKKIISGMKDGLDAPYDDSLFSFGQHQLIMIARAIVTNPDILLLDEITSGLDTDTEKLVLDALKKASKNRTVLSISHRLGQDAEGRIISLN